MALETGAVTPDGIEKWDGTKYPRQLKWNQDHTVISALKPSVLWLFQRIAPRIGAARMTAWLTKFDVRECRRIRADYRILDQRPLADLGP